MDDPDDPSGFLCWSLPNASRLSFPSPLVEERETSSIIVHRPLPSLDSLFFKGLSRDVCGRSMDDDGRSDRRSLALASSAKPLFLLGMNDDGRSGRSFPALCLAWER